MKKELAIKPDFQYSILKAATGYQSALIAYLKTKINYDQHTIRAPFPGKLTGIRVSAGQTLTRGQVFGRIVSHENIIISVGVLSTDIDKISVGDAVEFERYPELSGTVHFIHAEINDESKLFQVDIRVQNNSKIKPGMFVKAYISVSRNPKRLLVPVKSVFYRDNRKLVFVIRDGIANWCYVETGDQNNKYIEIVSNKLNLKPGDHVVTGGYLSLSHGVQVTIGTPSN